MRLLISKKAAIVATIASVPFVGAGSYFAFLSYSSRWPMDTAIGAIYSGAFFLLGSPLTLIYYFFLQVIDSSLRGRVNDVLVRQLSPIVFIPLPLLFNLQWIIWSQLIVWITRRVKRVRSIRPQYPAS